MLVFPRRFVEIEQDGRDPVIANPNRVILYNAGQRFRRRFVGEPDLNEAFHFSAGVLRDALSRLDPSLTDREPIFPIASAPISASVYLFQRQVIEAAPRLSDIDLTEAAFRVLDATLRDAAPMLLGAGSRHRPPRAASAHRDAVAAVQRAIAAKPTASHSLKALAAESGVSVYHLCRVFRTETGVTIGRFIHEQRLRRALEDLADPRADLTTIALSYGYSSHSHFTARFGEVFGMPPSAARRALTRKSRLPSEQDRGSRVGADVRN